MSGFSKFGIILTSVFSILLLALLAELSYLLWRCRQRTRLNCSRIEPTGATTTSTTNTHSELFKLEGLYGPPSRVLFTIKEEEKEELDENELVSSVALAEKKAGLTFVEHFGELPSPEIIIMVGDESDFDVEPPFLTPCTSPPYFTPSPSPTREKS